MSLIFEASPGQAISSTIFPAAARGKGLGGRAIRVQKPFIVPEGHIQIEYRLTARYFK
jgi:hypothetical protein